MKEKKREEKKEKKEKKRKEKKRKEKKRKEKKTVLFVYPFTVPLNMNDSKSTFSPHQSFNHYS